LRVKTGGILEYFEDLKRGTNKMSLIRLWRVGPKDFFEIASNYHIGTNNRDLKKPPRIRCPFNAGLPSSRPKGHHLFKDYFPGFRDSIRPVGSGCNQAKYAYILSLIDPAKKFFF
jgi:hypothetical protein